MAVRHVFTLVALIACQVAAVALETAAVSGGETGPVAALLVASLVCFSCSTGATLGAFWPNSQFGRVSVLFVAGFFPAGTIFLVPTLFMTTGTQFSFLVAAAVCVAAALLAFCGDTVSFLLARRRLGESMSV